MNDLISLALGITMHTSALTALLYQPPITPGGIARVESQRISTSGLDIELKPISVLAYHRTQ